MLGGKTIEKQKQGVLFLHNMKRHHKELQSSPGHNSLQMRRYEVRI